MTIVRNIEIAGNGVPVEGVKVTVRIGGVAAATADGTSSVVASSYGATGADGAWSFDLVPNSALTPKGTWYVVTRVYPQSAGGMHDDSYIYVPSSPSEVNFEDVVTSEPEAPRLTDSELTDHLAHINPHDQYYLQSEVDALIAGVDGGAAGPTTTADITDFDDALEATSLSKFLPPTGDLGMGSQKTTGQAAGVDASDGATVQNILNHEADADHPHSAAGYARIGGPEADRELVIKATLPEGTALADWAAADLYVNTAGTRAWLEPQATSQAPEDPDLDPASPPPPTTSDANAVLGSATLHYDARYLADDGEIQDPDNIVAANDVANALEMFVLQRDKTNFDRLFTWAQNNMRRTAEAYAKETYVGSWNVTTNAVNDVYPDPYASLDIFAALFRAWNLWSESTYHQAASRMLSDLKNYAVSEDNENRAYLRFSYDPTPAKGGNHQHEDKWVIGFQLGRTNPIHFRAAKTFTGHAIFDKLLAGYYHAVNALTSTTSIFGSPVKVIPQWASYNASTHNYGPVQNGVDGWTITLGQNFTQDAQPIAAHLVSDRLLFNETRGTDAIAGLKAFYTDRWTQDGALYTSYSRSDGSANTATQSTEIALNAIRLLTLGDTANATAAAIRSAKVRTAGVQDGDFGYYYPDQVSDQAASTNPYFDTRAWLALARDANLYTDLARLGANPSVGVLYAPGSTTPSEPTPPVVVTPPSTDSPTTTPPPAGTKSLFIDKSDSNVLWTWKETLPAGSVKRTRATWMVDNNAMGYWIGEWEIDVSYVGMIAYLDAAAAAGKTALLLSYFMTQRDLGHYSAGGAATRAMYEGYIDQICTIVGTKDVLMNYEPDALPHMPAMDAQQRADRNSIMNWALQQFKTRCPNMRVYIDCGHSAWHDAAVTANLLKEAGIQHAAGFAGNTSNIRPDAEIVPWLQQVWTNLGMPDKRFIYDSGRNGNPVPSETWNWANPPGRQFGKSSQFGNTGIDNCDGWMWWKKPGESDGAEWSNTLNMMAPSAGAVFPEYLYNDSVGDNQTASGMLQRPPAIAPPNVVSPGTTTPLPTTGGGGDVNASTYSWYANGTQPTGITLTAIGDIFKAKYAEWKSHYVVTDGMPPGAEGGYRIRVPDLVSVGNNADRLNHTFSEGIGYGMIIAALASRPNSPIYDSEAKAIFDGLLKYYKACKNSRGLMSWEWTETGVVYNGDINEASDGDEDAATGMLLMERIHGNAGTYNYGSEADAVIAALRTTCVAQNLFLPGNWALNNDVLMPDYFGPAQFKEFAHAENNGHWADINAAMYPKAVEYFTNNYSTGFVPNQMTKNSQSRGFDYIFGYNAIRMPWRLALDVLWNNDQRALRHLRELSEFGRSYTGGDVTNIRAGGNMDGSDRISDQLNKTFVAGYTIAGVADSAAGQWMTDGINWLNNGAAIAGITEGADEDNYFGNHLRLITLAIYCGEFKPYRSA